MDRITASPPNQAALLGLDLNGIMWTDATVNPGLYGCAKVSPACLNCYAEEMAARIVRMGGKPTGPNARYAEGLVNGRWAGRVSVHPDRVPVEFRKIPWTLGKVRRVFVTSMSDLFHEDVPFDFIDSVFVEMAARPQVFQVLTKRAERMAAYAAQRVLPWPANVWAGVTVEDQRRADERIPSLLQVPAAVRFLSVEPMLGAIEIPSEFLTGEYAPHDFGGVMAEEDGPRISWVIVGSESDGPRPGARETDPAWVLDIVDQCDRADVACFVKQIAIGDRLISLPLIDGRPRADFPA